jgi:hypothetical protein
VKLKPNRPVMGNPYNLLKELRNLILKVKFSKKMEKKEKLRI